MELKVSLNTVIRLGGWDKESVQWNWKTSNYKPQSIKTAPGIRSMELKGDSSSPCAVPRCWSENPFNGIESDATLPLFHRCQNTPGIRSMELKEWYDEPFPHSQTLAPESVQWNWKNLCWWWHKTNRNYKESVQWNWKLISPTTSQ